MISRYDIAICRFFEGTPEDALKALGKLEQLPDETQVPRTLLLIP